MTPYPGQQPPGMNPQFNPNQPPLGTGLVTQPGQVVPPQPPPPQGPVQAPGGVAMPPPGQAGAQTSPEAVKAILGASGDASAMDQINRQRKVADLMRQQGSDQLKAVDSGKFLIAPGGAQLAASLFSTFAGARGDMGADRAMAALGERQGGRANTYFNEMFNKPTGPANPNAESVPMGAGTPAATNPSWLSRLFASRGQ